MDYHESDRDILIELRTKVGDIHKWVSDHEDRIRQNTEDINRAKGGWMATVTISSVIGAIGGHLAQYFKH